jgi:hypothetical protein
MAEFLWQWLVVTKEYHQLGRSPEAEWMPPLGSSSAKHELDCANGHAI